MVSRSAPGARREAWLAEPATPRYTSMNALLTSAQTRLDEALSGQLADPVGAAIMAMYDALMSSLTAEERSTFVDHPNAEAVQLAVTRLALPQDEADHAVQVVQLYYAHNRDHLVPLSDAVRLACRAFEVASQ